MKRVKSLRPTEKDARAHHKECNGRRLFLQFRRRVERGMPYNDIQEDLANEQLSLECDCAEWQEAEGEDA